MLYCLKSISGLCNEWVKYMTDAGSTDMSTVTVAVATVKSGMLSIAPDGV
ncbi:MAG: hypothetical protein ACP5DZ_06110 [Bacteroidales bacterium]